MHWIQDMILYTSHITEKDKQTACVKHTGLAQARPKKVGSVHSVQQTFKGKEMNWGVLNKDRVLWKLSVQDTGVVILSAGLDSSAGNTHIITVINSYIPECTHCIFTKEC